MPIWGWSQNSRAEITVQTLPLAILTGTFFLLQLCPLSWRHVAVEDLHLRVPSWSIWKLRCVQNFSAYMSPPKSKMQNVVYYKINILRLIIYDTYTCNMFPSVRSSIGGLLGKIIQHLWNSRFLPCTMTVCWFPKLTNLWSSQKYVNWTTLQ